MSDNLVVGKEYVGHDGYIYLCESRDHCGLWMMPTGIFGRTENSGPPMRKNVSLRAVGRTFHHIFTIEGVEFSRYGRLNRRPLPEGEIATQTYS